MSNASYGFPTPSSYGVRNLGNLEATASTARVLNLVSVAREWSDTPEYSAQPFFRSRILNTALFVKHRLRRDEAYVLTCENQITTKIILPLHREQLELGGQSVMLDHPGWRETLAEVCGEGSDLKHDVNTLRIMNKLPSFDPFLLREHLSRHKVEVAACYFAISPADVERMRAFVGAEVTELITLAFGDVGASDPEQTTRLVSALLSTRIDSKLEPLRLTFGMTPSAFSEGVFSWKGFLYYKWSMQDLRPRIRDTLVELGELKLHRPCEPDTVTYVNEARVRIRRAVGRAYSAVNRAMGVYDDAFRDLTVNGNPKAFCEFLISAPDMFLALGETMGALSHIASFWRFRFPEGARIEASGEEAHEILRDFEIGLGERVRPAAGSFAA